MKRRIAQMFLEFINELVLSLHDKIGHIGEKK